ncbi:MAG: hypothetical protein M3077_12355 [Candidatus Dormibacteraeota bacterium]|nr:hypothetical protein [Candidatus Dormibacteraeota bacterium]
MRPPISWIVGFGRFWYHFIIGDDWTMAVAVTVGLVVTAVLNARGVLAFWLIPLIVIGMLGISLRHASKR